MKKIVPVPCAIIDETHLCLLPHLDETTDDANEAKIHTGVKIADRSSIDNQIYYLPAIQLANVYKICGQEYITSIIYPDDDDNDCDTDDVIVTEVDNADETDANMNIVETIKIRASDMEQQQYRFNYPTKISTNGSTVSCIRVSSYHNVVEGGIYRSALDKDNGSIFDVILPKVGDESPALDCLGGDDNLAFYGDESCNVWGSSNEELKRNPHNLEVRGCGSCILADFLGAGGYEQSLILPMIDSSIIVAMRNLQSTSIDFKTDIQQYKQILHKILANSFITDGSGILLSKELRMRSSLAMVDGVMKVEISPIQLHNFAIDSSTEQQNAIEVDSPLKEEEGATSRQESLPQNTLTMKDPDVDSSNGEQTTPPWLEAIEKTVRHRLAEKVAYSKQLEKTAQVRRDLVSQGIGMVHRATRCNPSVSFDAKHPNKDLDTADPEVVRIRYGTRPRTSMDTSRGVSVVMDLELDISLQRHSIDTSTTVCDAGMPTTPTTSNSLHDLHVSCLFRSTKRTPFQVAENIRTISAVVPLLHGGDCVTVLASVFISSLQTDLQDASDNATIDLCIQGLWVDATSVDDIARRNPTEKKPRQGAVLCILRFPIDSMLLSPPPTSIPRSGHWIQHEIEFADSTDNHVPIAIFDHRNPKAVVVDTSSVACVMKDASMWKKLVSSLNDRIGGGSHVDLYWVKGQPILKLIIFGSNPEDRATTLKILLQNLPESAKLVQDDPEEAQRIEALLKLLKLEADAMKRHYSLLPNNVDSDCLAEIAQIQYHSDGIASTLKRGWI